MRTDSASVIQVSKVQAVNSKLSVLKDVTIMGFARMEDAIVTQDSEVKLASAKLNVTTTVVIKVSASLENAYANLALRVKTAQSRYSEARSVLRTVHPMVYAKTENASVIQDMREKIVLRMPLSNALLDVMGRVSVSLENASVTPDLEENHAESCQSVPRIAHLNFMEAVLMDSASVILDLALKTALKR